MDYKKVNASKSTVSRDMDVLSAPTGNIYETINILIKRSSQISTDLKEELDKKLKDFASYTDNLEEVLENREQIEISKYYEGMPKSTLIAIQEFLEGKIYHRMGGEGEPDGHTK